MQRVRSHREKKFSFFFNMSNSHYLLLKFFSTIFKISFLFFSLPPQSVISEYVYKYRLVLYKCRMSGTNLATLQHHHLRNEKLQYVKHLFITFKLNATVSLFLLLHWYCLWFYFLFRVSTKIFIWFLLFSYRTDVFFFYFLVNFCRLNSLNVVL